MVRPKTNLWSLFPLLLTLASPGKAADCQKPTLEGNVVLTNEAILKNEFPDGSDITLECSTGYEVDHGSEIMTCTSGVWTVPNLICKKKDCGPPNPLPNGKFEMPDGTLFGATIKPLCDRRYMLQGSSYRQCLAHGWVGRPRCVLITCEKPAEIANGNITRRPNREQPEIEDVIEYSCNPSYTLIGNRLIFCQDDGEYSSMPPVCKAIECQAPQIPFGVLIKGESHYTYKSEAVFQCQSGHIMKGSPSIVCEEHGWSELPACIKETTTIAATTTTTTIAATTTTITIGTSPSSTSTSPTAPLSRSIPHNLKVIGIVTVIGILGFVSIFIVLSYRLYKRKGSYNTGEALKMKEELLQTRSQNLI